MIRTRIKLVTAGGDYNADGSFTAGEKVVSAVGNGQQRNMSQKIAAAQNYEMFDWRQSNQSLTQENELKCHLIALAIDYSPLVTSRTHCTSVLDGLLKVFILFQWLIHV